MVYLDHTLTAAGTCLSVCRSFPRDLQVWVRVVGERMCFQRLPALSPPPVGAPSLGLSPGLQSRMLVPD